MKRKIIPIILVGILVLSGLGAGAANTQKSSLNQSFIFEEYDMVIIAPDIFSDAIQPLIDHKNDVGIHTFLKTTDDIYDEYEGRDQAEQVKYFIKDAIETYNISYVLLIGGRKYQFFNWHVPVRYSNVDDGYMDKQFLTDLYFADIYKNEDEFEDWDSNGNGVFSEWVGDNPIDVMDLIPDVYLGRLPCRNLYEVNDIVEKIINYENNAFNQSWFKNILLVGGDTNPGVGEPFPYEGEVDCEWILQYLSDFSPTRLYASDGSLNGPDDFISAFNNGYGFVLYHGHGLQDELKTFKPDSQETIQVFHNNYVPDLTNDNMFPVTVVGCCLTTNFDVGIFDFFRIFKNFGKYHRFFDFIYSCVLRCIGWNMVKKSDGGSIAHIGSSSTAWGETGDKNNDTIPDGVQTGFTSGLCTEFFRVYGEDEKSILGEIYADALSSVVLNHSGRSDRFQCKCVQEFQLIGDPSLKIGGYS
jgi:hypothetical protein